MFNLLMPIVVTSFMVVHYYITKPCGEAVGEENKASHGTFHWNIFCTLCFLIYPNTSRVVISIFRCHTLQYGDGDQRSFLYADYSLRCYEGNWYVYAALAGCGVLL